MVSVPSIVIGTFIYAILVRPFGHFSGWAGAVALAIIMIPVVLRTTEDMLSLVPWELREAAFALGAPYYKVIIQVVYRGAATGILTGILLEVATVRPSPAPFPAPADVAPPAAEAQPTRPDVAHDEQI